MRRPPAHPRLVSVAVLAPVYPLRTERLLLRPVDVDDAAAMAAYQGRDDVCRYIPYHPRSVDEVRQRFADGFWKAAIENEGDAMTLGVTIAATGELIGDLMLRWVSDEHRTAEIGYAFHPDHGGQGYATEAARALLPLAFDGLGAHRVIARIDARNTSSANLCRRLGMRQEAHLRQNEWFKGEWTDEIDFGLLEDDWRAESGT